MNYWQNKKQGHKDTRHTNAPHALHPTRMSQPADTTTKFSELQDHTKKHDLNKIKKHIRYQPRTPTPPPKKRGVPVHCHNIPFHQYTSSQHNTQLCLKRIEQSTLLSSQTTHHTNNNTPSESSSVGQWYRRSKFWATTYTTILAFMKKRKLKTLCFTSHNLEIHSKSYAFEIVSQMWEINFKSYTV